MLRRNFGKVYIIIVVMILVSSFGFAENDGDVYVIPITGEINKATSQFVNTQLENIKNKNVSAVIFEIDTYGGLISEAEKIKESIMSLEIPTIAFVNKKAESAGVLITISNDYIVMAEGASIGSAETIPNTEKVMSMWVTWLRTTAEQNGRDSELVAAMADKDIEIEGIVKEGDLLNLGHKWAYDLGFADAIANNYNQVLKKLNLDYEEIKPIEKDLQIKIAEIVVNPYVAAAILAIGFIGFVIEILTPGFGVGGTIGLLAFALFFGGNMLAGNSNWGAVILFVVGLILLLVEAVAPGFGIPGIGGIISVVLSVIMASSSIETAIMSLAFAVILAIIAAVLLIKYGPKNPYLDRIILSTKQENKKGYTSNQVKASYVGKEGLTLTTLRPAGTILIDDIRLDVVSEGGFIAKNSKVKVVKIEGSKIIVRKID
ncbi:NfeD family protein [Clostridiisalibacter paucivorans]|uniref:NfeD family protein n=1 Tax=Clostridiisalibacter paucivorans TaxID=408753 RepID=UPI0005551CCC|nr:NfeD family protein [Clostridiisalibacter paucivorans]